MSYASTVHQERFVFPDLRTLLAKANEEKSGDQLAQIAATTQRERVAAKMALADVGLEEFIARPLLDPADDDVTQAILMECLCQAGDPTLPIAKHFQDGCDQPLPTSASSRAAGQFAYDIIEQSHRYPSVSLFSNFSGCGCRSSVQAVFRLKKR